MYRVGVTLLLSLVGCTYTPPGPSNAPNDGPADVQISPDSLPDPNLCTDTTSATCIGNVLRKCETVGVVPKDSACAICVTAPAAHCETLVPSANGATAVDLAPDGNLLDITIAADTEADTDSGEIQGVRPGGEGVLNGIGFRIVNNIAVWRFHSLTINKDIDFRGGHAAVLAANRTIDVNDKLDVRGDCSFQNPGPGGSGGGIAEQDGGGGTGKGLKGNGAPDNASGGSGGGYGAAGSGGASSTGQTATTGGGTFGDAAITMLRGGAGGGGGGGDATTGGVGGGGGGALHLVANDRITIGTNGGINAGGCGGNRALFQNAAGGGGGSGGTILLEAVNVDVTNGILAVNGGGGGGGDSQGGSGGDGPLSRTPASAGSSTGGGDGTSGGRGGAGGAATAMSGTSGASGSANQNAGGGGGGVGRIRINTRDDLGLAGNCTACSPSLLDLNTTATRGAVMILKLQ